MRLANIKQLLNIMQYYYAVKLWIPIYLYRNLYVLSKWNLIEGKKGERTLPISFKQWVNTTGNFYKIIFPEYFLIFHKVSCD